MILMAAKDVQPLISDTVGTILATGLVSLAVAVITLILTNRHSRKEAEAQRREARRVDVRKLVAQFVHAGVTLASTNQTLVAIYYKAAGTSDLSSWSELSDTETGGQLKEDRSTIARTGRELKLLVRDEKLRDAITKAIDSVVEDWPMKELMDEAKANGGVAPDGKNAMGNASMYFQYMQMRFEQVEGRASSMLQVDL